MAFLKPALTLASTAWFLVANASIEAPRLGFVRLANQEIWSLRGIAGSFYYGERMASETSSLAFHGEMGIRVSPGRAELLGPNGEILRTTRIDGDFQVAGLSPIEDSAFVLTATELWKLTPVRAERFEVPTLPDGRLVGISGAGPYVDFAIASEGLVSVRRVWLESGEVLVKQAFTAAPGRLLFLPDGMLLWTEGDVLILRRPDASLALLGLGTPLRELQPLGKRWMQATGDNGQQFAIEITGDAQLPQSLDMRMRYLPETAQ